MLPPEILDQVTALNLQHREVVAVINQLSRPSEIATQLVLDDLSARIKGAFADADRAIEVASKSYMFALTDDRISSRV